MAHDVEHAAALQAGRGRLVQEVHRHVDGDQRVLAETQEIDMDGEVAHRIELHVAGDHPRLGAVEVEHEDRALEMAGMELLGDGAVVDRDRLRLLLVAVKDAGNTALAADERAPPLPVRCLRPSLEFHRLCHDRLRSRKRCKGPKALDRPGQGASGIKSRGLITPPVSKDNPLWAGS